MYAEPGSYRVRLTVEDDAGLRGYDQTTIKLKLNVGDLEPPVARIEVSSIEGEAQLTVTFKAEYHDDDGSVVATAWDFFEESLDDTDEVTRTFTEPGYYPVRFQARDNDGLVANDQVTVTVLSGALRPPRIVSVAGAHASVGLSCAYDADQAPSAQGSRPLFWRLGAIVDGGMVATDDSTSMTKSRLWLSCFEPSGAALELWGHFVAISKV